MRSMPPAQRLPTTTSLQLLLAVAERGSTAAAARASNLTQSAVSKRLKALENAVGMALFRRTGRGLALTHAGEVYLPYARAALEQMAVGKVRVRESAATRRPIRLHMQAILGERWLLDRFPAFAQRHPETDVQFTNFISEDAAEAPDIDLRYGNGDWADSRVDYLMGKRVALVASPGYLARIGGISAARDVQRATLLQHFQMPGLWAEFTEAHGLRGAVPAHTVRYGYMSLIVRSACAGLGVGLVATCFVREELANGSLVVPAGLEIDSSSAYYIVRAKEPAPGVETLCRWIVAEARGFEKAG
ncbi:MAG: LysR family transcriptional regulator [Rhodospirillales bacterium]|nr:LysR family transcriptional regulator [Rhodospirillales bacterium]